MPAVFDPEFKKNSLWAFIDCITRYSSIRVYPTIAAVGRKTRKETPWTFLSP
jgi:hypothetical protein